MPRGWHFRSGGEVAPLPPAVRPRRRSSLRARRARALAALVTLVVVGVLVATHRGGDARPASASRVHREASAAPVPAVEAGLLPWSLPIPLSREVVLAGEGGNLVVLGGLNGADASESAVLSLGVSTGTTQTIGQLADPTHDAAGSIIGRRDFVFGGGSAESVGTVESYSAPITDGGSEAGASSAERVATLPAARSDEAAATIGKTTYLVGGYDGTNPDAAVLATEDGRGFETVASLKIPVRYPAVAVSDKKLYVFGGEAVSGLGAGQPVDTIQVVDPATHDCRVVGHLPETLDGAAAVTIGGQIYLAGGESTAPQPSVAGVGTTQVAPSPPGSNPGAGKSGAITDAEGLGSTSTVRAIWAFDPTSGRMLQAGRLQLAVSHAGIAVIGQTAWVVGGESGGSVVGSVQMFRPNEAFGSAGAAGAGSPYFGGRLLVADRGNNRLLLFDPQMKLEWSYPSPGSPANPDGFYFPDDAFFIDKGTAIISNEEENETIEEIAFPSGKVVWSYGHEKQPGSAPGYLHEPDDAYLLKNGQISVADAQNCRVLVLDSNGTVAHQIGTTGVCVHDPPVSMGSPNGDTPLLDGNLLVSEINGSWVSEYTTTGTLVWTVHLPISYPSDPQQIGPDLYLIADYSRPGQILEFNRQGQILYRYDVASGPGMLDHPSLTEQLPSGVLMANDDYRNRMVAIDPDTGALVWQYGINDQAGTATGMLNTPDGFDLLMPGGSTPTHRATG